MMVFMGVLLVMLLMSNALDGGGVAADADDTYYLRAYIRLLLYE